MPRVSESKQAFRRNRVLIAGGSAESRCELGRHIESEPDLEVCGESATLAGIDEQTKALKPDLIIIDIPARGKGGFGHFKKLRTLFPNGRFLAVASREDPGLAERLLRAGAHGYILSHDVPHDLALASRDVLRGTIYLSEAVLGATHTLRSRSTPQRTKTRHARTAKKPRR